MAVSMNAGGNLRADFMISDAALPLRIEEIADEQAGMFAKLLSDIGEAKDGVVPEVKEAVQSAPNLNDIGEPIVYRDKETGRILPEDPWQLAALIVKGEVKLKNVPAALLTPELMKLLMLMKKAGEFNKDDEDDDEDESSTFDPVEAIAVEQAYQQELSNSMLMELYQIIEKHNERESEDKVTMLDGIFEPIDPTETLPSVATTAEEPAMGEGMFTEIIDNLVETVSDELENVEKAAAEGVIPDVDVYVPSETAVETEAATDVIDVPKVSAVSDVPVVSVVSDVPDAPVTPVVSELSGAETDAVIPQDAQDVVVEVNAPEQVVSEAPKTDIPVEQPVTVQAAVSQNEQTAETTAQQTVPVEEFTVKTVKTEAKPEIAENAVKTDNTEEPVVVRVVTRNDNAEQLDKTASEEPKTVTVGNERVKSATEELEMLKNAKAKFTVKTDEEKPVEEKLEVKPGQTAQPLNADQPVVFKRADGSEFEVRPSEIIRQTARLVERAVTENDDKTEYSLVLNPEELGKITVKLTKAADGAISITIAAENARTQRILEQNSNAMQDNLRSNGLNLESWQTVSERQQETAAQDYNGSSKNPYFRDDDNNAEEESDGKSFADIIASM